MPSQSAVRHLPLYLIDNAPHKTPEKLTVHQSDFVPFAERKLTERLYRIDQLEKEVDNLKDDRRSYRCAIVCLVITLGIVVYQWLVVCHGQAPA